MRILGLDSSGIVASVAVVEDDVGIKETISGNSDSRGTCLQSV